MIALARWVAVACLGGLLLTAVGCGADGRSTGVAPAGRVPNAATPALDATPPARPSVGPSTSAANDGATAPPAGTQRPVGPPIVPTPGGSRVPFRADGTEIGPVIWATRIDPATDAPIAAVEVFPSDAPVLYATLEVVRLRPSTTLTASWSYNGSPLASLGATVRSEREQQGGWIEFHIARDGDDRWPPGVYAVVVAVDGVVAQNAAVRVDEPPAD